MFRRFRIIRRIFVDDILTNVLLIVAISYISFHCMMYLCRLDTFWAIKEQFSDPSFKHIYAATLFDEFDEVDMTKSAVDPNEIIKPEILANKTIEAIYTPKIYSFSDLKNDLDFCGADYGNPVFDKMNVHLTEGSKPRSGERNSVILPVYFSNFYDVGDNVDFAFYCSDSSGSNSNEPVTVPLHITGFYDHSISMSLFSSTNWDFEGLWVQDSSSAFLYNIDESLFENRSHGKNLQSAFFAVNENCSLEYVRDFFRDDTLLLDVVNVDEAVRDMIGASADAPNSDLQQLVFFFCLGFSVLLVDTYSNINRKRQFMKVGYHLGATTKETYFCILVSKLLCVILSLAIGLFIYYRQHVIASFSGSTDIMNSVVWNNKYMLLTVLIILVFLTIGYIPFFVSSSFSSLIREIDHE